VSAWDELQFELSAVRGIRQVAVREGYSPTVTLPDNPLNHWCDLAEWQQQKPIWRETMNLRVARRFEAEPKRAIVKAERDALLDAVRSGVLAKLESYDLFPPEGTIARDLSEIGPLAIVWRALPAITMHNPDELSDGWTLSVYCRFAIAPKNVALGLLTTEAEEAIQ